MVGEIKLIGKSTNLRMTWWEGFWRHNRWIALRAVVEVVGDDRLSAAYLRLYPARLPSHQVISGKALLR